MITIKRLAVLIVPLIFFSTVSLAQSAQKLNLPNIIPPSPNIQNFMRYGEIPVDYSTGVPSINIPLYTLSSSQLSVPISLSYHASGIKVQDKASTVGLGWVLNCGGYITETILGNGGTAHPVYTSATAFRAARPGPTSSVSLLQGWYSARHSEISLDWTSDRFSYQLPGGEAGVFRYTYDTHKVVKLPYTPTKIMPNSLDSLAPDGHRFVLVDAKGVSHYFDDDHTKTVGTYYIKSVVSADKADTIRFTYKTLRNEFYNPNWTSILQLYCLPSANLGNYQWMAQQPLGVAAAPSYNTQELVPDSIITSTTIIRFITQNDREDIQPISGKQRITGMEIRRRSDGKLIKSVSFVQSYFGAYARKNQRLRLDSVKINGNNNLPVEKYRFVYETGKELPPYPELLSHPDSISIRFREDYWGYYNGTAASNMIPMQFVPVRVPEYAVVIIPTPLVYGESKTNRNPDSLFARAAMLKEIYYPTGGKTVFDFEPNRAINAYFYDTGWTVPDYVGGFRVRAIKNYLEDGTLASYKYYRYGQGKTRRIEDNLFTQVRRDLVLVGPLSTGLGGVAGYPNLIITSSAHVPLTCDNGPPVFYAEVAEYTGGVSVNAGKTLYTYDTPPDIVDTNLGFEIPVYEGGYFQDRGNYVPRLLNKKAYKRLSNGSYRPVSETISGFTKLLDKTYHMGMKTTNLGEYFDDLHAAGVDYPYNGYGQWSGYDYAYQYYVPGQDGAGPPYYQAVVDVSAIQEAWMPTQTIQRTYDLADSSKYVAKTTDIAYGSFGTYVLGKPIHTEPTQTTTVESNGETYINTLSYPAENSSGQPYNTMVSRNILMPVIEEKTYKTNTGNFLQSTKTDYSFWDSGGQPTTSATDAIYPKLVSSKQGVGGYEARVEYSVYAQGRSSDIRKSSGPHISYLYDKAKVNPVAQVTNAQVKDIFYESFEDGIGNSAPDDSKTGHYSSISGISKSLSGLSAGNYTLSYWSKQATTWVLNVSSVAVPGSTAIINLSGQVDDVRFYPATAQMVTFTYDGLVGQTSTTNARNMVTYYVYDAFGRLKTIKDKDNNIVKSFCYNYKGQITDCFAPEPPPPPIVYVRIEGSSYNSDSPGSYESDYWVNSTATLTIRFYANAACTVPYTLTSAMTLKMAVSNTVLHEVTGNYTYGQSSYNFSLPTGVSSFSLGVQILSSRHHSYDSGSGAYWDDYYSYDYQLPPDSSSNYTVISPTY